jgi:hypothetical protein
VNEKPDPVEVLARKLVAAAGNDPDHMVAPTWLAPYRFPIVGGYAVSAQDEFAPVPLWRCYADFARKVLETEGATP